MREKALLFFAFVVATTPAQAGLDKWIKNEVIPTVTGDRPLKIKPYVKFSHDDKVSFQLGQDNLYVNIGGVTVQTHQLKKRLIQAGCVIETGNVAMCAPDVLERELQNVANSAASASPSQQQIPFSPGVDSISPYPQQYPVIAPMQSGPYPLPNFYCCDPASGLKVCQLTRVVSGVGTPCQCSGIIGIGITCF